MLKYFSIFIILLVPVIAYSQETKLSDLIVDIAEELAADDSDPEAVSMYIERLQELSENPVTLNSSDEDEISRLFFLSDFQVKAIIDYSHSTGSIMSVFEIANIPGFDKETAEMMTPFITLDNNSTFNTDSIRLRSTSLTNLSDKLRTTDSSALGSSWKILSKYKFSAGVFTGGFTIEKDPGEKFLTGRPALPDFLSAYLTFNGRGVLRRFIIGDFSARFGQGTNINTGTRAALSLTAPGYMSARNEIKPYTSTDENSFFRGAAAEFSIKKLTFSLFYSRNYLDATLNSEPGVMGTYIESLYLSGSHTTSGQLQKKDAVADLAGGFNASYNFNILRIGMSITEDKLSYPLRSAVNDAESVFDFSGNSNTLCSVYYNCTIKRILLYGELSTNGSFNHAIVQGISLRPTDRLFMNFLFRSYEPGYTSFHGKGPGSSSASGNLEGLLGNFTFEMAKHMFLSAGCDIQYYPWLKYRCSAPTMGIKQEVRWRFLPTDKLTIEALYNYRLSMLDNSEDPGIPGQNEIILKNLKGSVHYSISDDLTLGTRFENKYASTTGSRGFLLSQDFIYSMERIPLTFWFRYCIFNSDNWDSRLYVYENDLLYSFSIPALSGEGSRSYVMIRWKPGDKTEIRFKYGITSVKGGNNTPVNTDEVKFQFKKLF